MQFSFLILLLILNGIFESFSIAAIIPFISIISFKNDLSAIPIAGKLLSFFGITDVSQSLLLITIIFLFFVNIINLL